MTTKMTVPLPTNPLPVNNTLYRADAQHYTKGREGHKIKLIVLHSTETTGKGPTPSGLWLSTLSPPPQGNVSAHHLYGRDGVRYDLVNRADTAYHTGDVAWGPYQGDGAGWICNLESIGHEFENSNTRRRTSEPYAMNVLLNGAWTVATEMISYGIAWDHVVCHRDIATNPPGRRSDPDGFPLDVCKSFVDAWLSFLRGLTDRATVARWFI